MWSMIMFLWELAGDLDVDNTGIVVIATIIAVVPLTFGIMFLVGSIKLVRSSRIVIKAKDKQKGKRIALPSYPFEVEHVIQCETQGLIRSNIARATTSADQFEPDAFNDGNRKAGPQVSYNYDESDGIPAVDRPLFKPKNDSQE